MKIVITGGGTGGHIYPALALVKEIKRIAPESEFLYIGTEKGLENDNRSARKVFLSNY